MGVHRPGPYLSRREFNNALVTGSVAAILAACGNGVDRDRISKENGIAADQIARAISITSYTSQKELIELAYQKGLVDTSLPTTLPKTFYNFDGEKISFNLDNQGEPDLRLRGEDPGKVNIRSAFPRFATEISTILLSDKTSVTIYGSNTTINVISNVIKNPQVRDGMNEYFGLKAGDEDGALNNANRRLHLNLTSVDQGPIKPAPFSMEVPPEDINNPSLGHCYYNFPNGKPPEVHVLMNCDLITASNVLYLNLASPARIFGAIAVNEWFGLLPH